MAEQQEQSKTVYCLTCRKLVAFVEADVKEREQLSACNCYGPEHLGGLHANECNSFNPPQIIDYITCGGCKEQITLGLPRFRSQPGPAESP